MHILGIHGSPRAGGNTETLVREALAGAASQGATTAMVRLNALTIQGCQACMACRSQPGCAVQDEMQLLYTKIAEADAIVFGSPVYMHGVTGQAKLFIDRLYPYLNLDFTSKVHKPTLFIVTQGNPNPQEFATALQITANVLGVLGFPVQTTVTIVAGMGLGVVAEKTSACARAREAGAQLVDHVDSSASHREQ